MDQGRLAEFDEPQKLLQNESTKFYSMAKDAGII